MSKAKILISKTKFEVDGTEIGNTVHSWSYQFLQVNGIPRMQLVINRFVFNDGGKEPLQDDTGHCIFGQCFINPDIKIEIDGGFEKPKILTPPAGLKVK